MNTEIHNLNDIASIINADVDRGVGNLRKYFADIERDVLENLAIKMAIAVSMIPDLIEED